MPERIKEGLEQHVQTLLTALAIAAIVWTGNQLIDYQSRLVRVETKLQVMSDKIDALHDAIQHFSSLDARVSVLERTERSEPSGGHAR